MTISANPISIGHTGVLRIRAMPVPPAYKKAGALPQTNDIGHLQPVSSRSSLEPRRASTPIRRPAPPAVQGSGSHKRSKSVEFRLIFSAAFAFFLFATIVERALPHKWPIRANGDEVRKSVVQQAKEAAEISTAYAFMG